MKIDCHVCNFMLSEMGFIRLGYHNVIKVAAKQRDLQMKLKTRRKIVFSFSINKLTKKKYPSELSVKPNSTVNLI